MCPIFFSPSMTDETLATSLVKSEDRLLERAHARSELPTGLLPRNRALDRVIGRVWSLAQRAARDASLDTREELLDGDVGLEVEVLCRQALSIVALARSNLVDRLQKLTAVRTTTREEIHRRLARAEDRMREEFDRTLSLAVLARTAHMSPWHFARRFSEFHGMPPHRFLTRLRMARARTLIEQTEMPLSEIARACGYSSTTTFVRKCKAEWGHTPGALRA